MKLKRLCIMTAAAAMLAASLSVGTSALEYSFDGVSGPEYCGSTNYSETYGAEYNYGGKNAVDFVLLDLPFGKSRSTSVGAMEKVSIPDVSNASDSGSGGFAPADFSAGSDFAVPSWTEAKFTSASGMERSDGSIGTVKIPSLGISIEVFEGETNASMAKGLGHYASTSGWDGNVGVCGHNRGAKHIIGSIKNLEIGDTVTYSTAYGTRTYSVVSVATIANTDWSYLGATADNRITLTTCLANQPAYRTCVQAVEVIKLA